MNEAEKNEKFQYWWWPEVVSKDQIKEINSICKKYYETDYVDKPADGAVKTVNVKGIAWHHLKPVLFHVMDVLFSKNHEAFGYSLFPINNIDFCHINIYDSLDHGEYEWHLDGSNSHVYDVKLTGILNISDEPYEGGEFRIFSSGVKTIPEIQEPGSLLLLKHGVLHKVEPVTKGKRKTISHWFTGPKFI